MRSSSEKNSTRNSQRNIRLVIDANILFAALIADNKTSELLFSETIEPYAPAHLFEEFKKYKSKLLDKTRREEQTFITLIRLFERNIRVIDEETIKENMEEAANISPDEDDTPYFAAAIATRATIWSNDKQLKEQTTIKILTTKELIEELNSRSTG